MIRKPPMVRYAFPALLAVGLASASLPVAAQDAPPRHTRRVKQPAKPAPTPPPAGHNINAPSTDFSKVERSGEEDERDANGRLRPVMGAGGMGLGGSF